MLWQSILRKASLICAARVLLLRLSPNFAFIMWKVDLCKAPFSESR